MGLQPRPTPPPPPQPFSNFLLRFVFPRPLAAHAREPGFFQAVRVLLGEDSSFRQSFILLGEGHQADICGHCQRFSRRTRRDRDTRLKRASLEASLRPQPMADSRQSATVASDVGSASSSGAHRLATSEPAPKSLAHAPSSMTHRPSSSAPASAPVSASASSTPPLKSKDRKKKQKVKKPKATADTSHREKSDVPALTQDLPEQLLATPARQLMPVVLSSSLDVASITSRVSGVAAPLVAQSTAPPSLQRRLESMLFDEMQMAYAFPCTAVVQHTAEGQTSVDPLRAELTQLVADLPRYQQQDLATQPMTSNTVALGAGAQQLTESRRCDRSRSPRYSPARKSPTRRAFGMRRRRSHARDHSAGHEWMGQNSMVF